MPRHVRIDITGQLSHVIARGNERDGILFENKYDTAGRLSKVTDALGGTSSYEYDTRGLKTKETGPDSRSVYYSYDGPGRLASVRDEAGNITRYAYDGTGRLASKTDARVGARGRCLNA